MKTKLIATLMFSFITLNAHAVRTLNCTPSVDDRLSLDITFSRDITPERPFVGLYEFGATLKVKRQNSNQTYTNSNVRMTPEVYTTDTNLRGDAAGVYLRLYPHFDGRNVFTHYTGQVLINDLDVRAYFNFTDSYGQPGFVCR